MKPIHKVTYDSYLYRARPVSLADTLQVVDPDMVASAAGALEGIADLYGADSDQTALAEVKLSVSELRNFVAYMRTLDAGYRKLVDVEKHLKVAVEENTGLKDEVCKLTQRIKLLGAVNEPEESQEAAASRPKGRAIARSKRHRSQRATSGGA